MYDSAPFYCRACRYPSLCWSPTCERCGRANTLAAVDAGASSPAIGFVHSARVSSSLDQVESRSESRLRSGFDALDEVTGGGLVRAAVTLIAGSPGAGKSTLLLQSAAHVSRDHRAWLVSGEEPLARLKAKAERLRLDASRLHVTTETELAKLGSLVRRTRPAMLVVDSIQTIHSDKLRSRPGSPTQLVTCALAFARLAASYNVAIALVGHVTKTNSLAGPRTVEHYVDAMIYFVAGKRGRCTLEASKNRFGAANVPVHLSMTPHGLIDVAE